MIICSAWRGKRFAVLGLARSGRATVAALLASGAEVVAWDADEGVRNELLPGTGRGTARSVVEGPISTGDNAPVEADPSTSFAGPPPRSGEELILADPLTLDLTGFAGVVVSPGVPLNRHPIAAHASRYGVPIIGDIELFAQARSELPPHKVIGITGTNGKSTTTALVHHILKTAGMPTTMGGNIGLPILGQEPLPEGGVYVLELSSYQIDLTFTLDCDVTVLLNVTPDHLDRYDGFEAYAASKMRLFAMQRDGLGIIFRPDSADGWRPTLRYGQSFAATSDARSIAEALNELSAQQKKWAALQGPHNRQNALAAIGSCLAVAVDEQIIVDALESYPGLPHRMERIREVNGVLWVNDSKATNPDSTAPALASYPAIHWILGGQAKTDELDACAPHFGHIRAAYTIGRDGPMLAKLLRPHMIVSECTELREAVRRTSYAAKPGETVLLSPACASFDQFRDYEARGQAFRQLVEAL